MDTGLLLFMGTTGGFTGGALIAFLWTRKNLTWKMVPILHRMRDDAMDRDEKTKRERKELECQRMVFDSDKAFLLDRLTRAEARLKSLTDDPVRQRVTYLAEQLSAYLQPDDAVRFIGRDEPEFTEKEAAN